MRGRKPKPTALKLITGERESRINRDEPDPQGEVKKPAFVKHGATRIWNQYAPELERIGVLKSTDVDMFGAWCCLMAEFRESPRSFNAARFAQLRALASSFGLEPSSRSRISVPKPKETDGAEEFFS